LGSPTLRFIGPAFRAKAAEDDVMLANCQTGLGFKFGRRRVLDHARHRNKLIAGSAMQVVMVRRRQLEAGAPIIEQHLHDDAFRYQFFGRAKDRRKVSGCAAFRETGLERFKGPGVVFACCHQRENCGGNSCFSAHFGSLR